MSVDGLLYVLASALEEDAALRKIKVIQRNREGWQGVQSAIAKDFRWQTPLFDPRVIITSLGFPEDDIDSLQKASATASNRHTGRTGHLRHWMECRRQLRAFMAKPRRGMTMVYSIDEVAYGSVLIVEDMCAYIDLLAGQQDGLDHSLNRFEEILLKPLADLKLFLRTAKVGGRRI